MGQLIHFSPRTTLTAAENLREFIRMCRDELTVFGADLDWNSWKWEGIVHFTRMGTNSGAATSNDRLDDLFIDFAKAYLRYQQGHRPTVTRSESKALRSIEAALLQVKGKADINLLEMSVLDEAAKLGRIHYSPLAAYKCGLELERLARFITAQQLISAGVGTWKNPIKKPTNVNIQTGRKAKEFRDKKLPNADALDAMAEIFANRPTNPKDLFTTSLFAMSMAAPSRGSELLELSADCEVEELDRENVLRYGWRFFSGKGYEGDIKWAQQQMVPVAKEAVRRIRVLTEEARKLARWIEENPSQFYRHANCPDVADDEPLTREQTRAALGITNLKWSGLSQANGVNTLNTIWRYAMSCQPENFPWLNKKTKLKYSNALFCMTRNGLHDQRATSPVILWTPDINSFNKDISFREAAIGQKTIFQRWGYRSADGQHLKMTSHQARHLLNTIADRGGITQDELAKWSGRADPKQNRAYIHVSEFEAVAAAETMDRSLTIFGPAGNISPHNPITDQELDMVERGPVHITEFGVCEHDWPMSPCEKFRDCINCQEHVCVKGDGERLKRLKARLVEVEKDYAEARDAIENGYAGADRWYESHEKTVTRLRQLVAILENPDIPDGSQIKLRDGKDYSHLLRVIQAKVGVELLADVTSTSLLSEANRHLGGGVG
jgi:hypothetical protein